ncbi:ABC transporter permease [Niveispirillum fermenti]|uniref:ABC transporter permease n=1 Tax=Niveispirillum fermenti TaxID=1233113 RepID=UPI003A864073
MNRFPLSLHLGGAIVALVLLAALAGPWLAPHPPDVIALDMRLLPPGPGHWAGTDEVGRDILSRMLWGLRASLLAGLSIVLAASLTGTLIGAVSGTLGRNVDMVLMRAMDMVMSLPGLVVAMALTAALGASLGNAVLALAVLSVPYYARVARAQAMEVASMNYVRASATMGAGLGRQLRINILPNIAAQVLVVMTLHIGSSILAVAALGFIGLGAQPPMAELGMLVNAGRRFILEQWWYSVLPGLLIMVAVLGFNLLGDGLRDLLDPKARNRSLVS